MLFRAFILVALVLLPQDKLVDRIVAVVNGEPILLSEVRQSLPSRLAAEQLPQLMQTNLEAMVNQALILQEVRRLKIFYVDAVQVERELELLAGRFETAEQFDKALVDNGLTERSLRSMIRRRLLIDAFIEYRFRRHTEIEESQLTQFYEGEWSRLFAQSFPSSPLPAFVTVRAELERLLRERRINEELDAWLEQARLGSSIIIMF